MSVKLYSLYSQMGFNDIDIPWSNFYGVPSINIFVQNMFCYKINYKFYFDREIKYTFILKQITNVS